MQRISKFDKINHNWLREMRCRGSRRVLLVRDKTRISSVTVPVRVSSRIGISRTKVLRMMTTFPDLSDSGFSPPKRVVDCELLGSLGHAKIARGTRLIPECNRAFFDQFAAGSFGRYFTPPR
jgi:hypothetical protein